MKLEELDHIWQEQLKSFDHSSDLAEYWNGRATTYESIFRSSSYSAELLRLMELRPEDTLLDIACGTGVTTIPLARKVRMVTALDISESMLARLRTRADKDGLSNIRFLNLDWNKTEIGKDVAPHDVVLVSRSLPGVPLSTTLRKFDLASKRACYLTWRSERSDSYEAAVGAALGRHKHDYPDYNVILDTLKAMGLRPRLDTFESLNEEKFPDLAEAVLTMARGTKISGAQASSLREIASKRLKLEEGFYCGSFRMKWALISWQK
jgi:SAM-dependent methyltransferase